MLKGWELQLDKCPCDAEFVEWMENRPTGLNIFHMGTGLHHLVGKHLYGRHNVLGLTYSTEEYLSYIDIANTGALTAYGYHVIYADIHNLNHELLPQFDVVTLFHLGEEYKRRPNSISPSMVLEEFIQQLSPGGRILAYANSAAKDISIPLFDNALELTEEYKHLRIYKKK